MIPARDLDSRRGNANDSLRVGALEYVPRAEKPVGKVRSVASRRFGEEEFVLIRLF